MLNRAIQAYTVHVLCFRLHKGKQKDRTKTLAVFSDHILNDYDTLHPIVQCTCTCIYIYRILNLRTLKLKLEVELNLFNSKIKFVNCSKRWQQNIQN